MKNKYSQNRKEFLNSLSDGDPCRIVSLASSIKTANLCSKGCDQIYEAGTLGTTANKAKYGFLGAITLGGLLTVIGAGVLKNDAFIGSVVAGQVVALTGLIGYAFIKTRGDIKVSKAYRKYKKATGDNISKKEFVAHCADVLDTSSHADRTEVFGIEYSKEEIDKAYEYMGSFDDASL